MILLTIFAILFNVVYANNIHTKDNPCHDATRPWATLNSHCGGATFFMENEIWKDVVGYEGIYKVSDLGNVLSLTRGNGLPWRNGVSRKKKQVLNINGRPTITLWRNGVCKTVLIHRLVAIAFIPNPENKPTVNHKNGVKTDNSVANLEWMTSRENCIHNTRVLKNNCGEKHFNAKLSAADVLNIRKEVNSGGCEFSLSKKYGVTVSNIRHIRDRLIWKFI